MIKNVIIAGVGGQGTIFAGKILGTMAYQTGLHVKISEIHGMSPVSYTHLTLPTT